MTTSNAYDAVRPAAEAERVSGALEPQAQFEGEATPADPWRRLMTLSAIIAVWGDLSVSVRRRIAADAAAAMNSPEIYDGPGAGTAPPVRRSDATMRH